MTTTYETGPAIACCSDGTNVWTITNADSGGVTGPGTIQKLFGTNGTVLETNSSSTLNSLVAITYAFGYIWVSGKDYPSEEPALYQINISDASIAATYTSGIPAGGSLSSDNSHLWATSSIAEGSASYSPLYKISTSGAVLGTYFSGDGYGCGPICFDGLDIWVGDTEGHQLLKVDPSSGSLLGLYSIGSSGTVPSTPQGLCTDGAYIWSANGTGHTTVTKTAVSSGSLIATYTLTETEPLSICTDGVFIYAVGNALTRIDILTGAVAYYDSSNGYLTNCINGSSVWCFQSPATGSLIGVYNF